MSIYAALKRYNDIEPTICTESGASFYDASVAETLKERMRKPRLASAATA